jgi:hypothetical protein
MLKKTSQAAIPLAVFVISRLITAAKNSTLPQLYGNQF